MREILRTSRLLLRAPIAGDLDVLYTEIFGDAKVMQYVLAGVPLTYEAAQHFFEADIDHEGFGDRPAVLTEVETGDVVGIAGLRSCHVLGHEDYEIGAALVQDAWGKRYASEILQGLLDYGLTRLGLTRVLGLTHPDNSGMRRIYESIGMTHLSRVVNPGRGVRLVYVASRD